ncbi:MAG: lysophospholipid acyltransferase family protein [Gammaproteobacteria bacterium]|nr:lysophospholipid acyltransferase family protein [Gammaproteobacteria bacterium]
MSELAEQIEALPVSKAGRFVAAFMPYRKRVILENIHHVYGDTLTAQQKWHLGKAFYSHLLRSIKETIQLRFMREKTLKARVEVKGHERLLEVAADQKGVLILTGHFGSFEFAPIGGILNFKQFSGQFHFIRRKLGSKMLERILFRRYYQAGLHVITKANALTHVTDALEQNHAVVFVLDQHASLANRDGVAAEFFGQKAGTYRSLATFARHTGVPVVPASSYRLPNGRHVLEFHEAIPWEEHKGNHAAIYQNTCTYNRVLEQIILKHPEQWWWMHRRWKL